MRYGVAGKIGPARHLTRGVDVICLTVGSTEGPEVLHRRAVVHPNECVLLLRSSAVHERPATCPESFWA